MRIMSAFLWVLGTFVASKIVGNFIFEMLNPPGAGVNLATAFIPALFSAMIVGFGFYKAFSAYKKDDNSPSAEIKKPKIPSFGVDNSSINKETSTSMSYSATELVQDEEMWEIALKELDGDSRKTGLWAKCFSESDGDENKARANYLRIRVDALKSESKKSINTIQNDKFNLTDAPTDSIKKMLEDKLYTTKIVGDKHLMYFNNGYVGCTVGSVIRIFENEKLCSDALKANSLGKNAKGIIVTVHSTTYDIC